MLQLFGYWRSSASFRVRLVLQLKGLDYEQHPVNLRQGEQKEKAYRRVNPQGLVPFLVDDDVHLGCLLYTSPLGTDGFEFVEYTAPDLKGIAALKALFVSLGFAEVAKHRHKQCWLCLLYTSSCV